MRRNLIRMSLGSIVISFDFKIKEQTKNDPFEGFGDLSTKQNPPKNKPGDDSIDLI